MMGEKDKETKPIPAGLYIIKCVKKGMIIQFCLIWHISFFESHKKKSPNKEILMTYVSRSCDLLKHSNVRIIIRKESDMMSQIMWHRVTTSTCFSFNRVTSSYCHLAAPV